MHSLRQCHEAAPQVARRAIAAALGLSRTLSDRFFTLRSPARGLAVARIVVGTAALLRAWDAFRILPRILAEGTVRFRYFPWLPEPDGPVITLLAVTWALFATLFAVGWRTRLVGSGLVVLMAYTLALDQQTFGNHLYLLTLVTALLVVADAGAALSLDSHRQGERDVPAWPITLLRLQVSIVYGFAAFAKLNVDFFSGGALLYNLSQDGIFGAAPARSLWVLAPIAIFSVVAEAFLAGAPWTVRLRRQAFVVALFLHAGMVLMIAPVIRLQIAVFALVMFAMLLLFLPKERQSRTVVWDGHCSFCGTWVKWLRRLDWLDLHRFVTVQSLAGSPDLETVRSDADSAIQLIESGPPLTGSEPRTQAFAAVRGILEQLPLSFLWAPLLALPPVSALGERVYAAVAARRRCTLHWSP